MYPSHVPFINIRDSVYLSQKLVQYMNHVYSNSLTESSSQISQPVSIKIPLREHQRTSAAALKSHEERMHTGIIQYDASGNSFYTRGSGGILGDPVGSGKSLTVLSYIANLKENPHTDPKISLSFIRKSDPTNYTVETKIYNRADPTNCKNLIVVPYSLIPQWRQYIKTQTTLVAHIIKAKTDISSNVIPIQSADLTIVSSTMYPNFIDLANEKKLWWERVFYDEADSIRIAGKTDIPKTLFTWYITASWPNIVLHDVSVQRSLLETIIQTDAYTSLHPDTTTWITEYLHNYPGYYYSHRSFQSFNYLNTISHLGNMNTYINIIVSSGVYYRHSFQLPPVNHIVHQCRRSAVNRALRGLIDSDVQQLIDADDIDGALSALHLNTYSSSNLLSAVEHRYIRDISNIELTITYRAAMEYVSITHKEEAIASLRKSKERVETQLATFRERLASLKEELCPICYDQPTSTIYSPCCNHLYCSSCILKCLRLNGSCPMCRTAIHMNQLVHIKEHTDTAITTSAIPRKHEMLLKILKENPEESFLVFSNYDNPFLSLADECEQAKIKYKILKGNAMSINKSIEDFDKGKIRVLFMNSREVGMGLNIVSAKHVVLYHSLRPEEEKQVVGRALRMGRVAPLTVHKLLHEGESNN